MTKRILTIVLIVSFTILGSWLGKWSYDHFFGSGASFDDQLMNAANTLNKRCPIMVDKDTRLDNTMGGPGKVFTYNYTLVNFTADQLDTTQLKNYLLPRLINNIRTNEDLKYFRDNEVTMIYRYSDKENKFLFSTIARPEDYR